MRPGAEGSGTYGFDLEEAARQALADYDARTPGRGLDEPLELTIAQAYALQAEIARLREQRGEKVIGYKVGCTSRPIRMQFGVQEPIFGRLFDTECHASGAVLSAARYANPGVEGELAVRLSQDLPGHPLSLEECRQACAQVFPVVELHHYVLPASWSPELWLIASGGLHAGFVLPAAEQRGEGSVNETFSFMNIRINEVEVGRSEDRDLFSRPMESIRWLAGRLAGFGLRLMKGQVILTGSPMNLFPVSPGERVVVAAPPLGVASVEFVP